MLCAGGEIVVGPGLAQAYEGGSGSFVLQARVELEGVDGADGDDDAAAAPGAGAGAGGGRSKGSRRGGRKGTASSGPPLLVIREVPYQTSKVRGCGGE